MYCMLHVNLTTHNWTPAFAPHIGIPSANVRASHPGLGEAMGVARPIAGCFIRENPNL